MKPKTAKKALLATHGGLSLEVCATLLSISPKAQAKPTLFGGVSFALCFWEDLFGDASNTLLPSFA